MEHSNLPRNLFELSQEDLNNYLDYQRQNKQYKRTQILTLKEENKNQISEYISFNSKSKKCIQLGKFYPYNSEGIDDQGWGCAWRVIQSMIYQHQQQNPIINFFLEFENLFLFFGNKLILQEIYKKNPIIKGLNLDEFKFAPFELDNGWAEPFIGYLVLSYFGIKSELIAINSVPHNAYAPPQLFKSRVYDYQRFRDILQGYFVDGKDSLSPIMIDDGQFAIGIIGFEIDFSTNESILYIADPHLRIKSDSKSCFYKVVLNDQGQQISNSISGDQKKDLVYENSYSDLHFFGKGWNAVIPKTFEQEKLEELFENLNI